MTNNKIKVCVIGIWHLGSVYAACLADLGYQVIGVDKDKIKIQNLNKGIPPLFEPGLNDLILKNISENRLKFTTSLQDALIETNFIFITFDTKVNDDDEVDLSDVYEVTSALTESLENGVIIIFSSQIPVGTCDDIKSLILKKRPSLDFDVACIPENLQLGQAINRFMHPERIVIGANNKDTLDRLEELFAVFKDPKIRMNLRSAEMTKHALNAFLATSISFGNEIGNICDEVGADAIKVAQALRLDSRIGSKAMLKPGLGFAGGTLARDIKILQKLGKETGYETKLINSVYDVNRQQNSIIVRKIQRIFSSMEDLTIGVFGLTYKAGTSTLRRSASLEIIKSLVSKGAKIKAYDPKADLNEIKEHLEFEFCSDSLTAAKDCDALVFVTDWPEFKQLNFATLKSVMKKPVIIDAQNMLDAENLVKGGFIYLGVGRGGDFNLVLEV